MYTSPILYFYHTFSLINLFLPKGLSLTFFYFILLLLHLLVITNVVTFKYGYDKKFQYFVNISGFISIIISSILNYYKIQIFWKFYNILIILLNIFSIFYFVLTIIFLILSMGNPRTKSNKTKK